MIAATVSGNLGKSAEVRPVGDTVVCKFSVASSTKVKGEKKTTWVNCDLWGRRGEALCQYLTKGAKVAVAGELSTREYEGKTYLEMRVSEIDLLGGGERSSTRTNSRNDSAPNDDNGYGEADGYGAGGDDDDIPFD